MGEKEERGIVNIIKRSKDDDDDDSSERCLVGDEAPAHLLPEAGGSASSTSRF